MKFLFMLTFTVFLLIGSKTLAQNCENLCISSYDPICASNPSGEVQMFPNICQMNLASCRQRIRMIKGFKRWTVY